MSHWKKLPSLFTRPYFRAKAAVMRVFVGGVPIDAKPKEFRTGSLGWHVQAKKQMAVGDALVWCQVSVQVTVIGSNSLPPDAPQPQEQPLVA